MLIISKFRKSIAGRMFETLHQSRVECKVANDFPKMVSTKRFRVFPGNCKFVILDYYFSLT